MERKTILLVEDDLPLREVMKCALERDYSVLAAAKCAEAHRELSNPFDLALIDYSLPDGNGLDIVRAIKGLKPQVPTIMMTGHSTESLAIRALRAGVTDYMKKPLSLACIRKRLAEILNGDGNGGNPESCKNKVVFIMDGIAAFLEDNFDKEDLTLDKLAGVAGMDKFRFCKAFKERFGKGFASYLADVRMKNAAELLGNPFLSITEIAYSVGYRSLEHFVRMFRAFYGVSPREYRRGRCAGAESRPSVADVLRSNNPLFPFPI